MFVTIELISGVSLGTQFISKSDLEDGDGWYLIIELLIFRIIVEK